MCEPTTIAAGVSIGMTVIGGLMSAQGSQAEGEAAAQRGRYNRQIAVNNAIVARHNARRAGEVGREQVADIAEKGRFLAGRQLTALAANGVVVDSGSGLDLSADLRRQTLRNIGRKRTEITERQAGFAAQAADLEQQGFLSEIEGSNAAAAANRKAQTTLVSTAGTVASQWFGFHKAGVPGFLSEDPGDILFIANNQDPNLT